MVIVSIVAGGDLFLYPKVLRGDPFVAGQASLTGSQVTDARKLVPRDTSLPLSRQRLNSATEQQYQSLKRSVEYARQQTDATYQIKTAGELGDGGAFEDWAFWGAGVPAFCLEMDQALQPSNKIPISFQAFERYEHFIYNFILAQRSNLLTNLN
jgi:hypothetical protein